MDQDSPVSLTESILVGFFEDIVEISESLEVFKQAFPDYKATKIDQLDEQTDNSSPQYILEPKDNKNVAKIFVAPSTVGISIVKYTNWESFRKKVLEVLIRASDAFGNRPYRRLLLRYIDVFHGESVQELSTFIKIHGPIDELGVHFVEGNLRYVGDRVIDEKPSQSLVRYSFQRVRLQDDDDLEKFESRTIAAISFDVATNLQVQVSDERHITSWLDGAHHWHKELFWRALSPEYRNGVGQHLFDETERAAFSQL